MRVAYRIALVMGLVVRSNFKVCCYFVDIVLAKWSKCEWKEANSRYPASSNYFFAKVILVLIKGKGINKGMFRSILGIFRYNLVDFIEILKSLEYHH